MKNLYKKTFRCNKSTNLHVFPDHDRLNVGQRIQILVGWTKETHTALKINRMQVE